MSEHKFMLERIKKLIIDVPNFPKENVTFKDIHRSSKIRQSLET